MTIGVDIHRNGFEDGIHDLHVGLVRVLDVEQVERLSDLTLAGPARRVMSRLPFMQFAAPISIIAGAPLKVVADHFG